MEKIKSSLTKSFIFNFLRNRHILFYSAYAILQVSLVAQVVKNLYAMQETQVQSLGQEGPRKKGMQSTPVFLPENPKDRGAWQSRVHGVTKCPDILHSFHNSQELETS